MQRFKTETLNLLDIFYKTAGVGALCFDQDLEFFACVPESRFAQNSALLSTSQIMDFLRGIRSGSDKSSWKKYYTFIFQYNFISTVVPIYYDNEFLGFFLTEPVTVQKLDPVKPSQPSEYGSFSISRQKFLKKALEEISVVQYDRIMSMGRVLYGLAQTLFPDDIPLQALHRETVNPKSPSASNGGISQKSIKISEPAKHPPYSTYLKIKGAIQSGDTAELFETAGLIGAGDVRMDQSAPSDFLRSIKNGLIKFCSLSCYAAIDAGAEYDKVMDQLDGVILRAEELTNAYDIYELVQTAAFTFTRSVFMGTTPYTKPVSQAMEYITAHYTEKITLKQLGQYTNLSTFYLSGLLRKETGRMLSENINKVRIEKSKQLLRDENISILEVALLVGFTHQNQYTVVFKKFTGITPSEFRKNLGISRSASALSGEVSHLPQAVYSQIYNLLKLLPELYDTARIVDPIRHRSWLVESRKAPALPESCYHFWQRSQSCTNCISETACLKNQMTFKIERRGDSAFLVLAIPRYFDENIYILELLKEFPGTWELSSLSGLSGRKD